MRNEKGTSSTIFMKTIDKFGELGVDTREVETAPSYNRASWMIKVDFTMCSIAKEASRKRIVAECSGNIEGRV
jgi:hypothetical protein